MTLSAPAVQALYSPNARDTVVALLTFYGTETVRVSDRYNKRLSETPDEIIYGLTSRGNDFTFIPFAITGPSDDKSLGRRVTIACPDIDQRITRMLREVPANVPVLLELVMLNTPDVLERAFQGLRLSGFSAKGGMVSAELGTGSAAQEPFPCYTFTPSVAPGLF